MNQYTMIEKALSEHKRLSTITGAQVLSISIVIHNDMEYDGSVCIGGAGRIDRLVLRVKA